MPSPLLATARLVVPRRAEPYMEVAILSIFNQGVGAACAAVLALLLLELGAAGGASPGFRRAAAAAAAFAFGTFAWAYARTFFTEPLTALLGLLAFRSLFLSRQNRSGHLFLAGLFAGFSVLVRFFTALLLPAYALYLLWPRTCLRPEHGGTCFSRLAARASTLRWGPAAAFAAIVSLFVLFCLVRNHQLYGSPWQTGYQLLPTGEPRGFTHPLLPGLAILLFAPGKSLFLFAPPALLGLVLLPRWSRRRPAEGALVGSVLAVYLAGYALWCRPEGGFTWGPRFLLPVVPLLLLPLAVPGWSRHRTAALALLGAVGLAVNALAVPVDFAQRLRVRQHEYYRPDGSYAFGFTPYADHLREALRVAGQVRPTPETLGRSRRHLIPDWSGEPDLWLVHLWREGHRPGPLLGVAAGLVGLGLLGSALLLRSSRASPAARCPGPDGHR